MHRHVLFNDEIREASDKVLAPGQVGLMNGWGVFSTIRVAEGVLFAFERHFARMRRDALRLRVPFPFEEADFERRLLRLVAANDASEATLRAVVVRNRGGLFEGPNLERDSDLIAFTTDLRAWPASVNLGLTPQARHAAHPFAGTKMLSWSFNLVWAEEATRRGLDEVVLLNERGEVSECTSANIFIAEGSQVWTPPLRSGCLPGVTRELLLGEVRAPGVSVGERDLLPADLERADEVFITSTTRKLLPVASIEGFQIHQASRARDPLQAAFTAYEQAYVSRRLAAR